MLMNERRRYSCVYTCVGCAHELHSSWPGGNSSNSSRNIIVALLRQAQTRHGSCLNDNGVYFLSVAGFLLVIGSKSDPAFSRLG